VKATPTELADVWLVESPVFADPRGYFTEVFHRDKYAALGLPLDWAQDNHSRSAQHVLRGMHYQLEAPQGKLVRVVSGKIFDVAVDVRRASPTFGQWVGRVLEGGDGKQLWIPPGFAHGFLVLSEFADVTYKCTTVYRPAADRSLRWDDATVGITWPLAGTAPLLAAKDADAPHLADCELYP
jgi:dTDP-4-dehydrorhamnose 3,5-epimerase